VIPDAAQAPAFPDYRFAPNIGGHPDVYEIENRALDRAGHVLDAMRALAPWAGKTIVDLGCGTGFWLARYVPELIAAERRRYPAITAIQAALGGTSEVTPLPVPIDCVDGFTEAYYARPEQLLDAAVRRSQSAWGFVDPDVERRAVAALARDLQSGAWDLQYGSLRSAPEFSSSLRLITARPG